MLAAERICCASSTEQRINNAVRLVFEIRRRYHLIAPISMYCVLSRACIYSVARQDFVMKGETGERWQILCKQAAQEQDPDKLLELCAEIDRMLSEKEERLRNLRSDKQGAA